MADQVLKPETMKQGDRLEEAFSVSVMPKEFRGKEGLKKMYTSEPRAERVRPEPRKVETPPKPVKQVTPEVAAKATLQQPLIKPKSKPWAIIIVAGVVIVLLGALGAVLLFGNGATEPIVTSTPTAPAPIVPTTPTPTTPVVPIVVTTPPTTPDPFAGEILPGKDTDSDGLTDIEEVVYGTKANRPDTDQDGFLDGNEVFHLFHPNGFAPQTLLDTGAVVRVQPEGADYEINRITLWQEQALPAQKMYMITSSTGESFQVVEFATSSTESLQDFYTRSVGVSDRQELESFRTKQGFTGIWTKDHLTAYVRFKDDAMLVFTYNLGRAQRVQYRQTFEMFINSLTMADLPQ